MNEINTLSGPLKVFLDFFYIARDVFADLEEERQKTNEVEGRHCKRNNAPFLMVAQANAGCPHSPNFYIQKISITSCNSM
jgi:hypothetical protein